MSEPKLERSLGPIMLWGLGVGYVISGMYFGWNLGLKEGGTLGLGIATFFIMVMYFTFSLSYSELACAIPKAGGAFDYARRALGKNWGFITGFAQIIEFVFAPPAIAYGLGAYFNIWFPEVPVIAFAIGCYIVFTLLNISGVKASATFELFITVLAVVELLVFSGFTLPHFQFENLVQNSFPHGWRGVLGAVPFAIWFFLGLEGIANVAEETINPQKNILKGFTSAIITLLILASLTFLSAVGIAGWESVVYIDASHTQTSDSPLPMALKFVSGDGSLFYHLLVLIGLFGFIASFNGLLLAAGRATYEFGRSENAPGWLGKIHPKFKSPTNALLFNMTIGILTLFTGETSSIITIATMGALTMYALSTISLFVLRKKEADLERPFKVPFYPFFPAVALVISILALLALAYSYTTLFLIYVALVVTGYILFLFGTKRAKNFH